MSNLTSILKKYDRKKEDFFCLINTWNLIEGLYKSCGMDLDTFQEHRKTSNIVGIVYAKIFFISTSDKETTNIRFEKHSTDVVLGYFKRMLREIEYAMQKMEFPNILDGEQVLA